MIGNWAFAFIECGGKSVKLCPETCLLGQFFELGHEPFILLFVLIVPLVVIIHADPMAMSFDGDLDHFAQVIWFDFVFFGEVSESNAIFELFAHSHGSFLSDNQAGVSSS